MARKAQFTRPDPGFSLYEGRTRGKRMKYTYSDVEDGGSDALSTRRTNRRSAISTPAEPCAPTFTASGRQVKSRYGGAYGESILVGQVDAPRQTSLIGMDGIEDANEQTISHGRPRRAAQHPERKLKARSLKNIEGYNSLDSMDDESDATSSGGGWDGGADEGADDQVDDEEEDEDLEMSGDDEDKALDEEDELQPSLVVSLRYLKKFSMPHPDKARQEVQPAHEPPIPLVMSSVLERPTSFDAIEPSANVDEGKIGKLSHDGSLEVSHTAPNMIAGDKIAQETSFGPENRLLQRNTPVSHAAINGTSQPRFGAEDNAMW